MRDSRTEKYTKYRTCQTKYNYIVLYETPGGIIKVKNKFPRRELNPGLLGESQLS